MKYFRFSFIVYVKTETPLKKATPLFPSNSRLKIVILPSLLFENLVGPPPHAHSEEWGARFVTDKAAILRFPY